MQITLRTAEEFHADHVTIEIKLTGDEARSTVDGYVPPTGYDPAAAAEVLAENYQRATDKIKDLEKQLSRWMNGHVCTDRCSEDKHVAFIGRQRLMDLEADIARRIDNHAELERQVAAAQAAREIETKRADEAEAKLAELKDRPWPYIPYQACCPRCQKRGHKTCDHVWCEECGDWINDTGVGPSCHHWCRQPCGCGNGR